MTKSSKIRIDLNRRDLLLGTVALAGGVAAAIPDRAWAENKGAPKRGGILKIGMGGGSSSDSLDPALAAPTPTRLLARQWGDTLIQVNEKQEAVGRLAESFTPNANASEWTFKIRSGIVFHDGTPLTPEDVAQTLRRHANPESQSVIVSYFQSVTSIEATEDSVVLRCSEPNADLPYLLADYHLPIQPNGGVDNPTAAIGTGPYKLVEATAGVRYVLEKNPQDWDQNRGFYDGVEILILNDSTLRASALQSGAVHMVNLVDPKVAKMFSSVPNVIVVSSPSRTHYAFTAMTDSAPFDNKKLLLAMKHAMNRDEIVEKILGGYGQIGNDLPVNSTYPFFADNIEQRSFDPELAQSHYADSGHDGSPIILCVAETVFPGAVDCALLWQASCNAVGIPLTVKRVPDEGYWTEVWLKQPFTTDNFLGRPVQDQQYSMFYRGGAEWNGTHMNNPEFDKMILAARSETDATRRTEIYSQMAQILWEEGGLFVPAFADFINAHAVNVMGWASDPSDELMGGYAPSLTWFT